MDEIKIDKSAEIRFKINELVREYCEIKFATREFEPGVDAVPVSGKVIDFEEISNMVSSSLDGWLTTGRFNTKFEKKLFSILFGEIK